MSQHKLSAIVNSAAAGVVFKLSDTPPAEGTEVGKLRSIQIDDDIWGIEASGSSSGGSGGSTVIANPELEGTESKLRGISIDSVRYSVMASEMSFSDVPVSNESTYQLANIQIGNDNWSILSETTLNTSINNLKNDLTQYTDTKISNLINSAPETLDTLGEIATLLQDNDTMIDTLNAAIGTKANASDVYTKNETDNKYIEKSTLAANMNTSNDAPRLVSARINGVDYVILPDVSISFTGNQVDNKKYLTSLTVGDDTWLVGDAQKITELENRIAALEGAHNA